MLLRFCICFVIILLYAFSLLTLFLLFHNLFCIIILLVKHVHHFDRKKMLVFFTNLSVMEFQVRYLAALFILFSNNRQIQVVLNGKCPQKYPVNAGVPQGSILGPTFLTIHQ